MSTNNKAKAQCGDFKVIHNRAEVALPFYSGNGKADITLDYVSIVPLVPDLFKEQIDHTFSVKQSCGDFLKFYHRGNDVTPLFHIGAKAELFEAVHEQFKNELWADERLLGKRSGVPIAYDTFPLRFSFDCDLGYTTERPEGQGYARRVITTANVIVEATLVSVRPESPDAIADLPRKWFPSQVWIDGISVFGNDEHFTRDYQAEVFIDLTGYGSEDAQGIYDEIAAGKWPQQKGVFILDKTIAHPLARKVMLSNPVRPSTF
jgi:hypothetical protein